jgi:GntR family transcriptional repressor for pyruvate dehydrogenase complex
LLTLRRPNLTDSLINEIYRMVSQDTVKSGERLPSETELAGRFGVGRSTVREAMKALSLMGVVEISPGKGTFFREMPADMQPDTAMLRLRLHDSRASEVYEARKAIEVELAALAAMRATPEDLRQIESALSEMQQTVEDLEAFTEADVRFHVAIAQASKNSLLGQFYTFAGDLVTNVIHDIIQLPDVKEKSIALHTETYQAIKQGDPVSARDSILNHMSYVLRLIDAEEGGRPPAVCDGGELSSTKQVAASADAGIAIASNRTKEDR